MSPMNLATTFALLCLASVSQTRYVQDAGGICASKVCQTVADSILQSMDKTVNPCQDFYKYACGNYPKTHPPTGEYFVTARKDETNNLILNRIKDILDISEYDKRIPPILKAKTMFKACIDAVEDIDDVKIALGVLKRLVDDGDSLLAVSTPLFGGLSRLGVYPLVKVDSQPSSYYSDKIVITIDAGNARATAAFTSDEMNLYDSYMAKVMQAVGQTTDFQTRLDIRTLETKLSLLIKSDLETQEDGTKPMSFITIKKLQDETDPDVKTLDWLGLLSNLTGYSDLDYLTEVALLDDNYINGMVSLLKDYDSKTIADYMLWRFLDYAAGESFGILDKINLQFASDKFGSPVVDVNRLNKCANEVKRGFGYLLSGIYVKKYLPSGSRSQVQVMSEDILKAFIERIQNVSFMDSDTKVKATLKADNMVELIGYPDWIVDESILSEDYELRPNMTNSHFINELILTSFFTMSAYRKFNDNDPHSRITRSTNGRASFTILPIEVNAENQLTKNAITIPAGIMQLPFYEFGLPSAYNFGALGFIIGHEITHGFDNSGRKFDEYGYLNPWWSSRTVEKFNQETSCFIDQYRHYCIKTTSDKTNVTTTECVRSIFTLGENIADNGGLESAYQAWKNHEDGPEENKKLPGLEDMSQEQLFYLGLANPWCSVQWKDGYVEVMKTDDHTPKIFRINGAVANSPGFARAFNCPAGPMNRDKERCTIW